MPISDSSSNRREFLKKGLTAAVGLGCLRYGLREALAQSVVSGRPVLTQASLNALIPKNPTQFRSEAQQARKDIRAFRAQPLYFDAGPAKGSDSHEPGRNQ